MPIDEDPAQPPEAPDIHRSLQLHPAQWIGISMLLLIPLLALFGLFGETHQIVRAETAELSAVAEYPSRYRYRMLNSIWLDVTNTTATVLDTVTVALDTAYASRFSNVVAIPEFEHPYTIELTDLEPGDTRRVRVELEGEHYGRHSGELRISAAGADTARLPLSTFVFP